MKEQQGAEKTEAAGDAVSVKKKRTRLAVILAAVAVVLALGIAAAVIVPRFFKEPEPNVVDDGFSTVLFDVPEDGSTPADHTALENVGYMNAVFHAQETWYSEMHGETDASIMTQTVSTYKQHSGDVLIVADVTTSSLVKSARQFCYVGDEVLWRLGNSYDADTFDKMLAMEWETGEPYARMSVEDFKKQNGLPATEFCVYVINEETLLSADPVVKNTDGTYTQTYYLDPAGDKAPAYYANQMVFSGGLTELPEFTAIQVQFTFDENWQVLQSVVDESYRATLGISINCSSQFVTDFEYGTSRAESTAYEEYFERYAGKGEPEEPVKPVPTIVGCLAESFWSVLEGPVSFDAEMTVNGRPLSGAIWLDIGNMTLQDIALRADLGVFRLWMEEGSAYFSYGGIRGRTTAEQLFAEDVLPLPEEVGNVQSLTEDLMKQLGDGDFSYTDDGATLVAELTFGEDVSLPLEFTFLFDEEGRVSLGSLAVGIEADDLVIDLSLCFGEEEPAALTEAEKASFVDLGPHLSTISSLFSSDAIRANLDYEGEVEGESYRLSGYVDLPLAGGGAAGELTLEMHGAKKLISVAYADGNAYFEVDGIRLFADADESIALLREYMQLPSLEEGAGFDLDRLLDTVLSGEFGSIASLSGEGGAIALAVKANELFELLGYPIEDLDAGDAVVTIKDGAMQVTALGVDIALTEGTVPTVETEGYIDILPYAKTLATLFTADYFSAGVDVEAGGLDIFGDVYFGIDPVVARAQLYLSVGGIGKLVTLEYARGDVFLVMDDVRLRAEAEPLTDLISASLGLDKTEDEEEVDAIYNLLSLDFSEVAHTISSADGVLSVVVNGNHIMRALGINYLTGNIELEVDGESVSAYSEALRAAVTLRPGNPVYVMGYGYIDLQPVLDKLLPLIEDKAIAFDGSMDLRLGETKLPVTIRRGTLTWEYGFSLVMECEASVNGARHLFYLAADTQSLRIVYGGFGVRIDFDDLSSLGEKFEGLMDRIGSLAGSLGMDLPDLSALSELLGFTSTDLGLFLSNMKMVEVPGALFGLEGNGLSFVLADERHGVCSVGVGYESEALSVGVGLSLDEYENAVYLPSADYFTLDDLNVLLDYVDAARNTFGQANITGSLSVSGEGTQLSGNYCKGTSERYVSLAGTVNAEPLYLQAWLQTDAAYASVSKYESGNENAAPLTLKLPISELPELLEAVAPGLDLGAIADLDIELLGDLIKSVSVGESTLSLTLDGTALGLSGDIRAELSKQKINEEWLLEGARFTVQGTEIALSGLVYGQSSEISPAPTTVQYDLTGVGSLGASLIKSLTDVQTGSLSLKDNICLQGTVTMSAMSMELPIDVYVCIQPQTEEGLVVNVRLDYEGVLLMNSGGATVDLTVKNGRMYIKRVTDGSLFKPSKTETMEVPLEDFQDKDKMGEAVGFMLNSTLIPSFIPEIKVTLPAKTDDYGTQAHHVLSQYSVVDDDIRFVINGAALLGDDNFNEVNLTFLAKDEYKTIEFNTSIDVKFVVLDVSSTVSGSLTLCEKEEMGYLPTDISGKFSEDGETGE